ARHDGPVRKMADKERLVDRDVFQRPDSLARVDGQHAVHQQEWIAVRQQLQDFVDVHHGFCKCLFLSVRTLYFFSRALTRSRSLCSCLSVAAFFSQAALSSMGKIPL